MAKMTTEMKQCVDTCLECHRVCLEMLSRHCLEEGGDHVSPEHVRLMLDCVQICQTSADFMTRGSQLQQSVCRACSEVCRACAESCEKVGGMDECVSICRKCSESCGQMAA